MKANKFLLLFFLIFTIITGLMTVRRAVKGSNDFDTFYKAGESVVLNKPLYYTGDYYEDAKDIGPFLYPPPAACFFAAFALLPIKISAFLWNTINIFFFILILFQLKWLFNFDSSTFKSLWRNDKSLCLGLIIVATAIVLDNLSMAQVNILIMLLCLLALSCLQKQKSFLCGLLLSIATFIKLTPVLFFFYLVFKREWKSVASFLVSSLIIAILVPLFFFGPKNTYLYYRQWVGRMIKPTLISFMKTTDYEPHPLKKSPEQLKMLRLSDMLVDKNQSLSASMTRLLLKNRNEYALSTQFPIYSARRYMRLPVLFGGVSREKLAIIIAFLQAILFLYLLYLWTKSKKNEDSWIWDFSLLFLSLTLFAPFARSHQFISLLFPFAAYVYFSSKEKETSFKWMRIPILSGAAIFLLQALPYGKAAGLATWSDLLLWMTFAFGASKFNRRTPVTKS